MADIQKAAALPDSSSKADFHNLVDNATIRSDVVTNVMIKNGVITSAKLVDFDSQTAGDVLFTDGTNWTPLGIGTAGKILTVNSGATAPEWSTPAGLRIQTVNTQDGEVNTTTDNVALGDSIPTTTDLTDDFLTLAITPTSATNKLLIEVVAIISQGTNSANLVAALFQDSTANALACALQFEEHADGMKTVNFSHFMVAGTTSETTFKVRAGSNAGTTTFNGAGGVRKYGGVLASSITITEIAV